MYHLLRYALALGAALAPLQAAAADPVADFYKGKELNVLIGAAPGGGYDLVGRLLARYLGRHLPGAPTMIVKNMPGAGGITVINHVANVAPKDGTVIGAPQSGSALEPVYHLLSQGGDNAKFDGAKL